MSKGINMATPVPRQKPQDLQECAMTDGCAREHALIRGDAVALGPLMAGAVLGSIPIALG
jgi:hypothetical protein